ncbi:unnamed protein product [Durusdinium trenchii]|uniref:Uncharacterized protein n=1 Tax=Durusdinium trenchii TaxID=1381693 RepID=A0ABP0PP19_9DINO
MVGTASFKKVAHFLRPWHWGSIAVISLSAACVLLRRNPKPMSARVEGWRLSRSELREVLKKYEKLVAKDARALQHSSTARLLGAERYQRRTAAMRHAAETNQRLVEQLLDDLPDDSCDRTALVSENRSEVCTPPARPVAEFRSLGNSLATVSRAYGTLQSVFAHLMRDWSGISEQTVISNQYGQLLEEVKPHLPRGSHVLVPGAGLGTGPHWQRRSFHWPMPSGRTGAWSSNTPNSPCPTCLHAAWRTPAVPWRGPKRRWWWSRAIFSELTRLVGLASDNSMRWSPASLLICPKMWRSSLGCWTACWM